MAAQPVRRRQGDRSDLMRRKLIDAAVESLIDVGYSKTTAVEVCRRADVTRGALFHHFDSLAALLATTMSDIYDRCFLAGDGGTDIESFDAWIDAAWARLKLPAFKAVIEIWLAARNEPEMTGILMPVIAKYSEIFSVTRNRTLQQRMATSEQVRSFYFLSCETMIGLALGRATTPGGAALRHEADVIDMLKSLARHGAL
jgi:AcrR family transcriptional regulator